LAGPLEEKRFWPLRERWFWILFGVLVAMLILPFLIVGLIDRLVPASNFFDVLILILIVVVVVWLLLKGYRDWTEGKKKEQEREKRPENVLFLFASELAHAFWRF
jgi:putative Ca2+/H+ antiporter (TMEM165/GDT1 family)